MSALTLGDGWREEAQKMRNVVSRRSTKAGSTTSSLPAASASRTENSGR